MTKAPSDDMQNDKAIGARHLILLAAIGALGSLATHMIVPALPLIADQLSFGDHQGQYAISIYLIALGLGQIIGGTLSDRYGRRPILLAAMILFLVGSALCIFAQSAAHFIGARTVQGLGGGGAIVVARAIISDLSGSKDIAKKIAGFTTILLISPAIAPFIGGVISEHAHWRSIFFLLMAFGALAVVLFLRFYPSIGTRTENSNRNIWSGFAPVIRNPLFWRFTAPIALATSAMYLFLSMSPFLLINQFGLSTGQAGLCYLIVALCCIVSTRFVGWVEERAGAFKIGFTLMALAGFVMALIGAVGQAGIWALIVPMSVIGFGVGLASPAGFAGILRSVKGLEGTSSALAGALQMLCAGLISSFAPALGVSDYGSITGLIFGLCLLGWIIAPKGSIHQLSQTKGG